LPALESGSVTRSPLSFLNAPPSLGLEASINSHSAFPLVNVNALALLQSGLAQPNALFGLPTDLSFYQSVSLRSANPTFARVLPNSNQFASFLTSARTNSSVPFMANQWPTLAQLSNTSHSTNDDESNREDLKHRNLDH
jgi:hypothetical protein